MGSTTEAILSDIRRVYRSLDQPNFAFARDAMKRGVGADVFAEMLRRGFAVEDLTDLNDDVSRHLLPRRRSPRSLAVRLSFVGPYAVILSALDGEVKVIASPDELERDADELDLVQICMQHGYQLLPQALLEEHISLNLFETDPANVCIFQALFIDNDVLPWLVKERIGYLLR